MQLPVPLFNQWRRCAIGRLKQAHWH